MASQQGSLVQLKQQPAGGESVWEEVGAPSNEYFVVANGTKHVMTPPADVAAILSDKFDSLSLTPAVTASQCIIDIIPTGALAASAIWRGICLNGGNLDPTGASAEIYGIYFDFSGVDMTNDPIVEGIHIVMPAVYSGSTNEHAADFQGNGKRVIVLGEDEHALWIAGEIHEFFDAGTLAAAEELVANHFVIDASATTGGMIHILNIAQQGASSADVIAVATHENITVIHQQLGDYLALTQGLSYDNSLTVFADVTSDINANDDNASTLFIGDNDRLYVGFTSQFDAMKFVIDTPGNNTIIPLWYYLTAGVGSTAFIPIDNTTGFQQSGIVTWDSSSFTGWALLSENDITGSGSTDNRYWIAIRRTRNNMTVTPVIDYVSVLPAGSEAYGWDNNGDVSVHEVTAVKSKMTPEGGFAELLTNKTGAASVKGTAVQADSTTDSAVDICDASGTEMIGVFYEDGIADGSDAWVVTSGRAQALLKDTTAGTRANWVKTSDVAGRLDATTATPPGGSIANLDIHMQEAGHCLQTITGGTDVLCWIQLQFN